MELPFSMFATDINCINAVLSEDGKMLYVDKAKIQAAEERDTTKNVGMFCRAFAPFIFTPFV